jgi:hypothetical protein
MKKTIALLFVLSLPLSTFGQAGNGKIDCSTEGDQLNPACVQWVLKHYSPTLPNLGKIPPPPPVQATPVTLVTQPPPFKATLPPPNKTVNTPPPIVSSAPVVQQNSTNMAQSQQQYQQLGRNLGNFGAGVAIAIKRHNQVKKFCKNNPAQCMNGRLLPKCDDVLTPYLGRIIGPGDDLPPPCRD